MNLINKVTVEKDKKFSESCLWSLQRKYFDDEGVHAWVGQVPYYVSSNPYIAHCYANIIVSFVADYILKNKDAIQHPFYILELGTGSGKFSFYLVKFLCELFKSLGLHEVKFRYVMTDFTKSNLRFWESHAMLKPYIDSKILDFAIYNLEQDEEIHLVNENVALSPEILKNPLIVCANYIFDTISHDAFKFANGVVEESLVNLTTEAVNMRGDSPIDWEKVTVDFTSRPFGDRYYEDKHFDAVLAEYIPLLTESHILMPMGAMKALRHLMKLSNDRLLLLSSDKGYAHIEELDRLGPPLLTFHGSFSMMVNFDAIGRYFKVKGGDSVIQSPRRGLKTCVFGLGFDFDDMWRMNTAIEAYVQGVGPCDYFNYHRYVSDSLQGNIDLGFLASHLNFSHWDPYVFNKVAAKVNEKINEAEEMVRQYFIHGMKKIANNFYYMPDSVDYLFDIGLFFHTLKDYENAIFYYQESLQYFGDQFNSHYNLGLCNFYVDNLEQALSHFEKSIECDSSSKEAKEWLEYVNQTLDKKQG